MPERGLRGDTALALCSALTLNAGMLFQNVKGDGVKEVGAKKEGRREERETVLVLIYTSMTTAQNELSENEK